jgi:hypothetical protein
MKFAAIALPVALAGTWAVAIISLANRRSTATR